MKKVQIICAMLVALGLAAGGFFIGSGIKFFRNFDRYVEVKGLAEQMVRADFASWSINFNVNGDNLMHRNFNVKTATL